jgi:phosphatidylglycerophosphatase A
VTRVAQVIATVFGVGYLKPAPGTWGAALSLPWGWLLHEMAGLPGLLVGIIVGFLLGWWATAKMTFESDDHDPSHIVIDEVVGQWVTLTPLSYAAWTRGIDILAMWPGWVAAFLLFRLFDVWKPWWVGNADRRGDPAGVMLDDVIAGLFAAFSVMALAALSHGLMGR